MAKLKCEHERRVHVFKSTNGEVLITHRSDGSRCGKRFVSLDSMMFDPHGHTSLPTATSALGPFLTIGNADDAKALVAKKARVKKIKRAKR